MNKPEPVVYLNGQYLPRSQAHLDIEDRGTLFADGVYEVVRYYFGKSFTVQEHLARLRQSLAAIRLAEPADVASLPQISDELVRCNAQPEASIYWQITRGSAPRKHAFPKVVSPTVLAITYPEQEIRPGSPVATMHAITQLDQRWENPCIKSLMLLANVLAKNQALAQGAEEAILHRHGIVTEGTSTNVFAVFRDQLWTHPADQWILGGITRSQIILCARELGLPVVQQTFTVEKMLKEASEVFISGSTTHMAALLKIDGQPIGNGAAGPLTEQLYQKFLQHILRSCGK